MGQVIPLRDDQPAIRPALNALAAERALIGAVMVAASHHPDVDVVTDAGGPSLTDAFYDPATRGLWQLLCERHAAGLPLGYTEVAEVVRSHPVGAMLGGAAVREVFAWVDQLLDFCEASAEAPLPSAARRFAFEIRDCAERRSKLAHAEELIRRLESDPHPLVEWYPKAVESLSSVDPGVAFSEFPLSATLREVMERVDHLADCGIPQVPGLRTGIPDLDRHLGGFCKSDLIVIAARPSIGKTALGVQAALHAARSKPVVYVTLEMTRQQIVQRCLAQMSGVDLSHLRRGPISGTEHAALAAASHRLARLPLTIIDNEYDWPRVLTRLQQALARGAGMVVCDYLGLFNHPGNLKVWERVGIISKASKQLAKRYDVPVVQLVQLNRDAKDLSKRPTMGDLRGSGDVEQDADVIMLLHRPSAADKTSNDPYAEIIVEKQRNGPTGIVVVNFRRELALFQDVDAVGDERLL